MAAEELMRLVSVWFSVVYWCLFGNSKAFILPVKYLLVRYIPQSQPSLVLLQERIMWLKKNQDGLSAVEVEYVIWKRSSQPVC